MTYLELEKKLKKAGYKLYRSGKGSHRIFCNDSGKQIAVPFHKEIKIGTLKNILKEAEIK